MMKTFLHKIAIASVLLLGINNASAIPSLNFSPVDSFASVGDTVLVDLTITLDPLESLGDFDISFAFDPSIVSLTGITFGTGLDVFSLGSIQGSTIDNTAGTGNIAEISLDFSWDLQDFQLDTFTLATLEFSADAIGLTDLTITSAILGDEFGDALGYLASTGSICVDCNVAVPEPGVLVLLTLGLIGMGASHARRKSL